MGALHQDAAFLTEFFRTIADRSRRLLGRELVTTGIRTLSMTDLARRLISTRGEASGVALAVRVLEVWRGMTVAERLSWFTTLAVEFGADANRLAAAVEAWQASRTPVAAQDLAAAAEPLRQELLRRINLAPGGTAALVNMREDLLGHLKIHPDLEVVNRDFVHLLSSWFNRGFLLMRRIDWSSPAEILEKIIHHEAVHAIRDWDDLRRRLQPQDRRCFAFFHPQMPDEPLIFVEVALTTGSPSRIDGLLSENRSPTDPLKADTAVFYSISNTQAGLKGISFGNFLIKQVVEELAREMPNLKTFVTLSPIPGFAAWLAEQRLKGNPALAQLAGADGLGAISQNVPANDSEITAIERTLAKAAAIYLVEAKGADGKPLDSVARFHLGNGASLDRIHTDADLSAKGLRQAHGLMVNYLYDLPSIEQNHEAYAFDGKIAYSTHTSRLLGGSTSHNAR